jgi:hypothetical protein
MNSLSDELLRLKSAVQQYEETRKSLNNVSGSTQKIGEACLGLAESTKSFVAKIEQIGIEEKLRKLQDNSSKLMQEQQEQSKKLKNTQMLLVALMLLEAAVAIFMFVGRR